MKEYQSKVTVKLSMSIDLFTESYPEDISDDVLQHLVLTYLYEQMQANLSPEAVAVWFDDFKIDEIRSTEGGDI